MVMRMFPALCVLITFVLHCNARRCTQQAFNNCMGTARNHVPNIVFSIFPNTSPVYLEEHCQDIEHAFDCLNNFIHDCTPDQIRSYEGLQEIDFEGIVLAYEWICLKGLDEYHHIASCLRSSDLHQEGQRCNDTFHQSLQTVSGDLFVHQKRMCHYMNNYLDCIHNAVIAECGEDEARWMREFNNRLFGPSYESFGCELKDDGHISYSEPSHHYHQHEDNSGWGVVVVLVIFILILTAGLVFTVICMILQQRRHKRELANRSTARFVSGSAQNVCPPEHSANGGGAVGSTHAGPLPDKNTFSLGEDSYPNSSSYVQFENDEPTTNSYSYASPQEVDITSGVGQYDLSLTHQSGDNAAQKPDSTTGGLI